MNEKESRYCGLPPPELVKALATHAQPGSKIHEEIMGALYTALVSQLAQSIDNHQALVRQLTQSIDKHQKAASRLAKQVLVLNVIFGAFTVAGAFLAGVALFR